MRNIFQFRRRSPRTEPTQDHVTVSMPPCASELQTTTCHNAEHQLSSWRRRTSKDTIRELHPHNAASAGYSPNNTCETWNCRTGRTHDNQSVACVSHLCGHRNNASSVIATPHSARTSVSGTHCNNRRSTFVTNSTSHRCHCGSQPAQTCRKSSRNPHRSGSNCQHSACANQRGCCSCECHEKPHRTKLDTSLGPTGPCSRACCGDPSDQVSYVYETFDYPCFDSNCRGNNASVSRTCQTVAPPLPTHALPPPAGSNPTRPAVYQTTKYPDGTTVTMVTPVTEPQNFAAPLPSSALWNPALFPAATATVAPSFTLNGLGQHTVVPLALAQQQLPALPIGAPQPQLSDTASSAVFPSSVHKILEDKKQMKSINGVPVVIPVSINARSPYQLS